MAGLLKTQVQLGDSATATQNFVLTSAAADGTMKVARGNYGATTQDVMTVDSSGHVVFPQNISQIRLNTFSGFGSTNTAIRRLINVTSTTGSDITYADSATLGTSLTINASGVYSISFVDQLNITAQIGLSLNSSTLTTGIASITVSERLVMTDTIGNNYVGSVSYTGYFTSGSIIRPHCNPAASGGTSPAYGSLSIVRVS